MGFPTPSSPSPLRDGQWAGRRCFIVGGGPSLRGFDWSLLDGELTIGVNRAIEDLYPSVLLTMDRRFWDWTRDNPDWARIRGRLKRYREEHDGIVIWVGDGVPPVWPGLIPIRRYENPRVLSPSITQGLSPGGDGGGNSGLAALNLAICLGASPIYLLGFDMQGDDTGHQAHYHQGYPVRQKATVYDRFLRAFNQIADAAKGQAKVYNCNPASALRCFEFSNPLPQPAENVQSREDVLLRGYVGFGDNLHQRAIARYLLTLYNTIYIETPIPEFYWDLPRVKFVRRATTLRTQQKNMDAVPPHIWCEPPSGIPEYKWVHGADQIKRGISIAQHAAKSIYVPYDFSLPLKETWIADARRLLQALPTHGKPVCIVRRPTLRKEWACETRNPKPEYFQTVLDSCKGEYYCISIADIQQDEEWFVGDLTGIDYAFDHGELPLTTVAGMLHLSDLLITCPGLFMLMGIALRARTFTIWGGHLPPQVHLDPLMGLEMHGYAAPDPACACATFKHTCNKEIPETKLLDAFKELRARPRPGPRISNAASQDCKVAVPPGLGDIHWIALKLESFRQVHGIEHLTLVVHEDKGHKHSHEYVSMLPFVDEVIDAGYLKWHWDLPPAERPVMRRHECGVDYMIEMNSPLECGQRIETILSEYAINWRYPLEIPKAARDYAAQIRAEQGGKLVLFYASSKGGNARWAQHTWTPESWVDLAEQIAPAVESVPVLLGADWDKDYAAEFKGAPIRDLVGQTTAPQAIALMEQAQCMVSYPGGLPVLATRVGCPVVMFWPVPGVTPDPQQRLRFDWRMPTAWVEPRVLEENEYIPMIYDAPETTPRGVFTRIEDWL